jgi:hypothetical protein
MGSTCEWLYCKLMQYTEVFYCLRQTDIYKHELCLVFRVEDLEDKQ